MVGLVAACQSKLALAKAVQLQASLILSGSASDAVQLLPQTNVLWAKLEV
jgi:hypothetical protein